MEKFDGYAYQYDIWFMENKNLYRSEFGLVKKALGDIFNKEVLSVGCGTGLFEQELGVKNGIEPSVDMGEIAIKRGLNVQFGTLETIELEEEKYDIIYFNGSSSYIDDLEFHYKKAYKALKKSGKIILIDVPKESAYGMMYLLAAAKDSFEDDVLKGVLPKSPYPLALVKSALWRTSEEKIEVLKKVGFKDFDFYQTLVKNPVYTDDEIEETISGYEKGSYVAIIGKK